MPSKLITHDLRHRAIAKFNADQLQNDLTLPLDQKAALIEMYERLIIRARERIKEVRSHDMGIEMQHILIAKAITSIRRMEKKIDLLILSIALPDEQ